MQLSSRQVRVFKLAILLAPGRPVVVDLILKRLSCSIPTLARVLKDVRETYGCEIEYVSAIHSYHMVSRGKLDAKAVKKVQDALTTFSSQGEVKASKVILDKDVKQSTSISLRMDRKKRLMQLVNKTGYNRSEIIEMLIDNHIEDVERFISLSKKSAPSD